MAAGGEGVGAEAAGVVREGDGSREMVYSMASLRPEGDGRQGALKHERACTDTHAHT